MINSDSSAIQDRDIAKQLVGSLFALVTEAEGCRRNYLVNGHASEPRLKAQGMNARRWVQ
jgi:hypothetical protein